MLEKLEKRSQLIIDVRLTSDWISQDHLTCLKWMIFESKHGLFQMCKSAWQRLWLKNLWLSCASFTLHWLKPHHRNLVVSSYQCFLYTQEIAKCFGACSNREVLCSREYVVKSFGYQDNSVLWYCPATKADLYTLMSKHKNDKVRLVAGNTGKGMLEKRVDCDLKQLLCFHLSQPAVLD